MPAAILGSTLNASSQTGFELSFILCLHSVHTKQDKILILTAGKKKFDYFTTDRTNFFCSEKQSWRLELPLVVPQHQNSLKVKEINLDFLQNKGNSLEQNIPPRYSTSPRNEFPLKLSQNKGNSLNKKIHHRYSTPLPKLIKN